MNTSEQQEQKPMAWRYMLADGKWRYQWDWSNGADMQPVYEMTPEVLAALTKN